MSWTRRGIVWGLSFIIPFVILLILIPMYTSLTLTEDVTLFIAIISFSFAMMILLATKGKLHLGTVFFVLGSIMTFIGFGAILGGVNFTGIDFFTLEPIEKSQNWQLSNGDLTVFAGIGIIGLVMVLFGIKQFLYRVLYGWK